MTVAGDAATDADRLGMPDSTVADENEFVMMADGMVGDFDRNVHTRTIDDVTDTLTVFDNRDDPTDVEFETFYSAADAADRDAVTSATASTDTEPAVVTIDNNDIDGNHDLFSSVEFPTGEDQTYTHVAADETASPPVVEERGGREFAGTFNGVPLSLIHI